jgi:hypothetical protein
MTPQETLAFTERQLANMEKAKSLSVKVGLPAGEASSSKAYANDGAGRAPTVLQVGIWHEYGTQNTPQRSFLRGPLKLKQADLDKALTTQFNLVLEDGMDVEKALGRVGATARNISVGAFRARGYGVWADIKAATKAAKGSSGILIDTGLLRNAITWVVE